MLAKSPTSGSSLWDTCPVSSEHSRPLTMSLQLLPILVLALPLAGTTYNFSRTQCWRNMHSGSFVPVAYNLSFIAKSAGDLGPGSVAIVWPVAVWRTLCSPTIFLIKVNTGSSRRFSSAVSSFNCKANGKMLWCVQVAVREWALFGVFKVLKAQLCSWNPQDSVVFIVFCAFRSLLWELN